jgi:CheY-like chemotaxis protein
MIDILVVEDNDNNFLLIKEILSKYQLQLSRASNGKEFYSVLGKTKNFKLVLMDFMLPDTNGIELSKYIIRNNFRIPIVFISAYNERCEEVYDMGIEYFIRKPINLELFISVLKKYVELKVA